jgi:DNA polymerase type B, organellar and viral
VKSPLGLMKDFKNTKDGSWCYRCSTFFIAPKNCYCSEDDQLVVNVKKRNYTTCDCGAKVYNKKTHACDFTTCKFCLNWYPKDDPSHRCPVYSSKDTESYLPFIGEEGATKKSPALFVFDLESSLILVEKERTRDFLLDQDGYWLHDENGPAYLEVQASKHVPNFVAWKNVFTDAPIKTSNEITDFLDEMMASPYMINICLAHNSSGYDSKFIYKCIIDRYSERKDIEIIPIMRGTRFMQLTLKIGRGRSIIFRDTMLHLAGSLDRLAKDYLKGLDVVLRKGWFPHLANKEEFWEYVGVIPELKYFDLGFTIKDERHEKEFYEWYETWEGRNDWDFNVELTSYCKNDVNVLATIVKQHHNASLEAVVDNGNRPYLKISPWHFPTVAGYVHQISLIIQTWDHGLVEEGLTIEELSNRAAYAAENGWCQLNHIEYYFDRLALRGGRTEIKRHYHKGKAIYVDIQSQYPFIQLTKSIPVCWQVIPVVFPVGPPTIELWDRHYYPCHLHFLDPTISCGCSYFDKISRNCYPYPKLRIKLIDPESDYLDYLTTFGVAYVGIFLVDFTPPTNLIHPVIPTFQQTSENGYSKCVYSLFPAKKVSVTSAELQLAVRMGYRIDKIYRVHRYKAKSTPWDGTLQPMIKMKIYNSRNAPEDPAEQDRIRKTYRKNFDMDIDFENWGNNPAKKATAKTFINSCWGKHAESVDHDQVLILNNHDSDQNRDFCQSVLDNHYSDISFDCMGGVTLFKYNENRLFIKPRLKNSYLGIAIFTTSYARMYLYNSLNLIGKNVLMCDTDSIVYDPEGLPDFVTGDCLGDWEVEHDNIIEFAALAPKSYGLRFDDGTSTFKTKGVGLKKSHLNSLNMDIAVNMIKNNGGQVSLPQMNFLGSTGKDLLTIKSPKIIRFDVSGLKGDYCRAEYYTYPYGYNFINS